MCVIISINMCVIIMHKYQHVICALFCLLCILYMCVIYAIIIPETENNTRPGQPGERGKDMKYYEITFDTKKGYPKSWIINITASTVKEAVEKAKEMWAKDSRFSDMHMFHIKARRLKDKEEFLYNYFAIVGK